MKTVGHDGNPSTRVLAQDILAFTFVSSPRIAGRGIVAKIKNNEGPRKSASLPAGRQASLVGWAWGVRFFSKRSARKENRNYLHRAGKPVAVLCGGEG